MPSLRYVPTGKFSQHSNGTKLERIRFIIIDDDSNSVFCPRNLSVHFGNSEKFKRYRFPEPLLEEEDEGLTGVKCINSPVASNIMINGQPCTNIIKTKASYLHASADTNKDDIGGQEWQKGRELLTNIHSCYHQSQVSNITKFVCWSHGPTGGYTPEVALLFKEGAYSTTRFDWQQSPHAAVFMCNDHGGVDKLPFGDSTVSGLEFVSLGEPIGNYAAAPGDTSSFISLIPGSDRADQLFDTLMSKDAKDIQRSQWDAGPAIISSSQSTDDEFLMMKSNKKTLWNSCRVRQTDSSNISVEFGTSAGKQLIKSKASNQAEIIFHPAGPPHRTLTWLPSKIPTQMASKVASFFPGALSKGTKDMEVKDPSLTVVASAGAPVKIITASVGKPHVDEKSKKVRERLPRLSRAQPACITSEKRRDRTLIGGLNPDTAMNSAGNDISTGFYGKRSNGKIFVEETKDHELKGVENMGGNINISKLITDERLSAYDIVHNAIDDKKTLLNSDRLDLSKTAHVMGCCKSTLITAEPYASGLNMCGSDATCILGKKKLVSSGIHYSKFDLRGLPRTCVRMSNPSAYTRPTALPAVPMTPPDSPVDGNIVSENPIFKDCHVQRGFNPIYPNDVTPRAEFENRVGGLENWYKFPMVQVAREYLPEGMKGTDWSWTDNDVSGEFIPGGVAW